MLAGADSAQGLLEATRHSEHAHCVVCGQIWACGLGLRFVRLDDGSVEAAFACGEAHQGYDGILHGGIASALLDGAMTNCLFSYGVVAVTAEMSVRFHHPIEVGEALTVRARLLQRHRSLYVVRAEVARDRQVKASATGKFMEPIPDGMPGRTAGPGAVLRRPDP
jgi:uncharacterized protein (TIGR00369 family)